MLRTRIIPALLLHEESLVKTVQFDRFQYVGDPCNTVRIFNELEVDELLFLDISATVHNAAPNLKLLADIANECFMPLGYGGGIKTVRDAKSVFDIGFEKVSVNSAAIERPDLITEIAEQYGRQAVIASIDVRKSKLGRYTVYSHSASRQSRLDLVQWAKEMESRGAGELLLTSIDREGTWAGFDFDIVKKVSDAVSIPVIAHGGAGKLADLEKVVMESGASAVALGSLVVYQKKGMGVLVNFPSQKEIEDILA